MSVQQHLMALKKTTSYTLRNPVAIRKSREVYKRALLKRKQELLTKDWEDLEEAAALTDNKLFWEVVNRPVFTNYFFSGIECHINPKGWVDHFTAIFNSEDVLVTQRDVLGFVTPLVNEDWLAALVDYAADVKPIQGAATGKTIGRDGVPIDLFKYEIDL
ncbi:hypothetical protein NDU88_000460 [Pleurodeles waltl]|uniref:Uncharacterized protein n=1 Tax=Pleurodeles waltl TaxID=8319 RepID=A0AAV7S7S4_PLEWA|nr:hypothetical protein NDU88_000460 [Pleurodeles waltl]